MLIEVKKGRKWVREHTTLQVGDVMRWLHEDQTAAFYRPVNSHSRAHLYNSFDNNDKFRFYPSGKVGPHEIVKMIADSHGLDFECRLSESDNHASIFVFIERKGHHPIGVNVGTFERQSTVK